MSWSPCPDPVPGDRVSADAIEMLNALATVWQQTAPSRGAAANTWV
jgi:hypothetical protein